MQSVANSLYQAVRRSRASISAGFLLILAIWIWSADFIALDIAGTAFSEQLGALVDGAQGFTLVSLALLLSAILGTVSMRATRQFVDPLMKAVYMNFTGRIHWQSKIPKLLQEHKSMISESDASSIGAKLKRWGRRIWLPIRLLGAFANPRNFVLRMLESDIEIERRWERKITNWIASRVSESNDYFALEQHEQELRGRLNGQRRVTHLVRTLRDSLRRDPSTQFGSDESGDLAERLRSLRNEAEFRSAVLPPIILLDIAISMKWSMWFIAASPLLIAVYASVVGSKRDLEEDALNWLLDADANSGARSSVLSQLHTLAKTESRAITG